MRLLTKEQILAADRKKTKDVEVHEWGGTVRLQEMSASDRDQWETECFPTSADGLNTKYDSKHARARLVSRCIIDEGGRRVFTDDERAAVGSLSASTIQKLFNEAHKLNAISKEDMKELEGNSDAGQSAGDSSTSASDSASPIPPSCSGS